ncbi:GSK3-beta interaction protein-like [Glandiceps talaboti]
MSVDRAECKLMSVEAKAAMQEVSFAVKSVEISELLPHTDELVHLNLKTKEEQTYCVELSVKGFRIVGNQFDCVGNSADNSYFETIYALLDKLSPGYRLSFGEALINKLSMLQDTNKIQQDDDKT